MKYRKLRIAWSVMWGVVAVLLCVLWVRSYRWTDVVVFRTSDCDIGTDSVAGGISASVFVDSTRTIDASISRQCFDQNDWPEMPPPDATFKFGLDMTANELFMDAPHWFVVAIAGILAAAPWLTYRFSLRTLLIATTLVAVVLGTIVWLSRAG